jgi:group II intron reverse transcriptase/maturase
MQISLRGIANKAKRLKDYRFLNLYTMLNEYNLVDSWRYVKKNVAYGVDKVSAREFEQDLQGNVRSLVERLKRKSYRAKLVRRQNIPKGKGKVRPLGIAATIDKLLQMAVARILNAIFEQDFLPYSFGYRPGIGTKNAIEALHYQLQYGWYGYIVEADIKGFFDHINHAWLIQMLSQRINDTPFVRLIGKWLRAGILDTDGKVIHPVTGTPQGGIVSPILANVYLHYVVDLWFEKAIKPNCNGSVYLCRYADDFVVLFQYKQEAEWFYRELPNRLGKFDLEVSADKTQILSFSKFRMTENSRFDFLGFEFRWGYNRQRKPQIKRRTSRQKLHQSIVALTRWCRAHRDNPIRAIFRKMNARLRGYYNYYGIIGNYESLKEFFYHVKRIMFKWLNRRSERRSYNWNGFNELMKYFGLLRPRITQPRNYQLNFQPALC